MAGMDSSKAPMTWIPPVSLWLAPGLLLAAGVLTILFDGLGLQSALSNQLFDAYQRHAAQFARDTMLTRPGWATDAEALLLALLGIATIGLLRFGLGWSAALAMAGAIMLGFGSWYLYATQSLLLDAETP